MLVTRQPKKKAAGSNTTKATITAPIENDTALLPVSFLDDLDKHLTSMLHSSAALREYLANDNCSDLGHADKLNRLTFTLLKDFFFLCDSIHKNEKVIFNDIYKTQTTQDYSAENAAFLQQQINAAFKDDVLYVRVPLLFSRFSKSKISSKNQKFPHYLSLYTDVIRSKIREAIIGQTLFFEKNIDVVNIYNEDANFSLVPDADNIDSKATVDAILELWPGGDGPMCSYSASVMPSNTIIAGTYITVTKGFQSQPNRNNFEKNIIEIFPNSALNLD